MSLDTALSAATASIFAALGVDASVQRQPDPAVTVRVVIVDSEETNGQHSQRIGTERRVQFNKAVWDPRAGDTVTINGITRTVSKQVSDDGYVAEVIARG